MKRISQRILLLCAAVGISVLLTGCLFDSSVEELYTLPRLPDEYTGLETQIDALLSSGMEYAPPTGGNNTQSVQMADLDGDGEEEAIAFFRKASDAKPLKIYIFTASDGSYQTKYIIESSGTSINSIYYRDVDNNGRLEVIVGWRISADVQAVAVYRGVDGQAEELMRSSYSSYTLLDVDADEAQELVVFRTDSDGNAVAECYGWEKDALSAQYSCRLSMTMAELNSGSVVSGYLESMVPALFVTGVSETGESTTDILIYKENGLVNVTLDSSTGRSAAVFPNLSIKPQDINNDGLIEVPVAELADEEGVGTDCLVVWRAYDRSGKYTEAETTYYDRTSGWYFVLPDGWSTHFTASPVESGMNENTVSFQLAGETVMSISTITGENRENRAVRGNRVILQRQTETIYAGEVFKAGVGIDDETMKKNFHLIVSEWISNEI